MNIRKSDLTAAVYSPKCDEIFAQLLKHTFVQAKGANGCIILSVVRPESEKVIKIRLQDCASCVTETYWEVSNLVTKRVYSAIGHPMDFVSWVLEV